jgi:hypothetical protein
MASDVKISAVLDTKAAVENSMPVNIQYSETEKIVIYDECGDTLWDEVLEQDEINKAKENG